MVTTIQVSEHLRIELQKRKIVERETYEEVIWNMMEDLMEVNEETKKDLEEARADFKAGRYYTHEEVKKKLGIK